MKKIIIYSSIILLIVIFTVGGTYAFFVSTANTNNGITASSAKLDVVYTGGTEINGKLKLVKSKEGGFNTTVRIKLGANSVDAKANLYIQIEEITETIATEGLVWEVYKEYDGVTKFVDSGGFDDCQEGNETKKCATGDKLYIVNDYILTTTDTFFTVYIWLNGDKVGNEALESVIKGYIGAETEPITTQLNN